MREREQDVPNRSTRRFQVWLELDFLKRCKVKALQSNLSLSDVIRCLLAAWLRNEVAMQTLDLKQLAATGRK